MTFTRAIVRPPGPGFVDALTTAGLGRPDPALAAAQHAAYCTALADCGLALTVLPVDDEHPDSTFVEDTAVVTSHGVMLTRPGAPPRRAEVETIRPALESCFGSVATIEPPGTLDGGDVCDCDGHFLIGLSERTNDWGATQLAAWLGARGFSSEVIDCRPIRGLLHLKTGIGFLGDGRMAATLPLLDHPALARFALVPVPTAEAYAANCLRVGDRILLPAGYPTMAESLAALGLEVVTLEMSELRKADGGLSCLSLRW